MLLRNHKGQSTVEYAIIVAVVISALLVMQFWMRRGVMGKLRESSDSVGEQFNPFAATHNLTKTFGATRHEKTTAAGATTTSNISENQGTAGTETTAGDMTQEAPQKLFQ